MTEAIGERFARAVADTIANDRITWLRILCSGFRPVSAAPDA